MGDEEMLSHYNLPPFNVNVLVIDDDAISLNITMGLLTSLNYKVVGARHPTHALDELRNHQRHFHLIVTEVHMPDLDGFKLKEVVDKEFAIPIIMISFDNNEEIQEKALRSGVVRYILKPVVLDDFNGIWQYVIIGMKGRRPISTHITGNFIEESSGGSIHHKELNCSSFIQEEKRHTERASMNTLEENGCVAPKKLKVIWTNKLQSQFLKAINIIGLENAVPKKILQVMDVEGLTRENVASHLQKYRLFLKRVAGMFTLVKNKANEDKDFFFSKMATMQPSLVLKIIQEDMEKTIKQSGRRTLNLESNDAYISHLRYKISLLLSIASNSEQYFYNKMNPYVKVGLSPIDNFGITNNATRPHHPYPNVNDAYELGSASNLVQNICKSSQNPAICPSGLVNYNFDTLDFGQASSSNFVNCKAMASFQGRVGSSQIQPNRNDVPIAFGYGYDSMNDGNNNGGTFASILNPNSSNLVGGVVSTTNDVYSLNQSSPMSIGSTNTENIVVEDLFQPEQQQHQIYDQGHDQAFATKDDNFASQVTSDGSQFEGIDDNVLSVESILNEVLMQDINIRDDQGQDNIPSYHTMHTNTIEAKTSTSNEEEAINKDICVSLNQCDDDFPSLDQFFNQLEWDDYIESIFNDEA